MAIKRVDGESVHHQCDGDHSGSVCGLERTIPLSELEIHDSGKIAAVKLPTCTRCGGTAYLVATTKRDFRVDHLRRVLFNRVYALSKFADSESETQAEATRGALTAFYEEDVEGRADAKQDFDTSSRAVEVG